MSERRRGRWGVNVSRPGMACDGESVQDVLTEPARITLVGPGGASAETRFRARPASKQWRERRGLRRSYDVVSALRFCRRDHGFDGDAEIFVQRVDRCGGAE